MEVADLFELFHGSLSCLIRSLARPGDFAAHPKVVFSGGEFSLADVDQAAGKLVEKIGLLDEVAAGLGQRGEFFGELIR